MGTILSTLINRLILIAAIICSTSASAEKVIKLASTTSTENSGLLNSCYQSLKKQQKSKLELLLQEQDRQ